jgi:hypothetical protein
MSARWQYSKAEPTPGKVCKDCRADLGEVDFAVSVKRPAPYPGPRCATHHHAEKRRRRLASANRRVEKKYRIPPELYETLYEFQGGRCAICQRATGASKRLAVDHDHRLAMTHGHPHDEGCPECVRGLVCSTCNDVLAHFRSDPACANRAKMMLSPGTSPMQMMRVGYTSWLYSTDGISH